MEGCFGLYISLNLASVYMSGEFKEGGWQVRDQVDIPPLATSWRKIMILQDPEGKNF